MIHTQASVQLHLLQANWDRIHFWAEQACMSLIADRLITCKDCQGLPPIDRQLTIAHFHKLPDNQQFHLAREITLAVIRNDQNAKFDSQQTETCAFCQTQEDSIIHRFLHCPATATLREAILQKVGFGPSILPVVHQEILTWKLQQATRH